MNNELRLLRESLERKILLYIFVPYCMFLITSFLDLHSLIKCSELFLLMM